MAKNYTYRTDEDISGKEKIQIQDVPFELNDGDVFLVFQKGSLNVEGIYEKKGDDLILNKQIVGKRLSDLYGCFAMIREINQRTYKMFAKRIRQIEKEDIDRILENVSD